MSEAELEIQTGIRISKCLHDKLRTQASAGERSLGAEIRKRLEASFETQCDPVTDQIFRQLAELALALEPVGGWQSSPTLKATFKAVAIQLIDKAGK